MNRRPLLLFVLCLLLAGCNLPQTGAGPQAWIDAPLDGSTLPLAPTEIVFHAYAAGNPKSVELTINGQPFPLSAPDVSQPLSTVRTAWAPEQPGRYIIVVRSQDQNGTWSEAHTHTVLVGGPGITISPTVSETPTLPLEISPTPTPSPTVSETPTLIATVNEPPTLIPTVYQPPSLTPLPGNVFSNLSLSSNTFYRLDATPTKVTFTISVNDPAGIRLVEIYFRLLDPDTSATTDWTNEGMSSQGAGVYTYTLTRSHPALSSTSPKTMIVEYQFIVTHPDLSLMRSPVYKDVTLKSH
jgi:hypothetical protein